jgi:hypothetical protein
LRRASCFSGRVTKLWLAGLLLIAGAAITLGLHLIEAPEHLYRWLYDHLLSGLDVPDEPPPWSLDAIEYVSLVGGLLELVAGVVLLAVGRIRGEVG